MKFTGIPVSNGVAIQRVYKWEGPHYNIFAVRAESIEKEEQRLRNAIQSVRNDLISLRNRTELEIDLEHAKIIDAHILILDDPEALGLTIKAMQSNHLCAEKNYLDVTEKFALQLECVNNEYLKERAEDIRDVCSRVLSYLLKTPLPLSSEITEDAIVVAHDMPPSVIATLDKRKIKGIVTEVGGKTSHSAIMTRSLGIPAVFGTKEIYSQIKCGETMIVDGFEGIILIDPSEKELKDYSEKRDNWLDTLNLSVPINKIETYTSDLHKIEISANILTPDDIVLAKKNHAEGIGLYRTEFLYMNNQYLPSEEEQFEAYKIALESFPNQKVVIRTLDVGADKEIDAIPFEKELNPFLGYRSIRFLMKEEKLFKTQLRAMLRASAYGNLCILFPMIAKLEEIRSVKEILEDVHKELLNSGAKIHPYQIGMMIEVPSSALMADQFAKEVDFFSVGTNDLIQYVFAADRMNENVSYLYEACHPVIMNLIKHVIDSAHRHHKWVGVCGEIAGDENASLILLGLGVDELSMAPPRISQVKEKFSKVNFVKLAFNIESVLKEETHEAVIQKLNEFK